MMRAIALLCGLALAGASWSVTATPVAAQAPDDPFTKLRRLATTKTVGPQGPIATHLLGLTGPGQTLEMYQIKVAAGADLHYFNVEVAAPNRVLLFSRIADVVYAFAMDPQMRPTAAARRKVGDAWAAVPIDSIRPQLQQMLGFWMAWAQRNAALRPGSRLASSR